MAIPLVDLEALAKACVDGDLDAFGPASGLGWTLTADTREALLRALAQTNFHRTYSYGSSAFTLARAISLISEAASNESGIAVTEKIRSVKLGKEVAIAFRHAGAVHFGVRYASNIPRNPGQLWAELKPWFKQLERNRARLEQWVHAEGNVALPLVARATNPSASESGAELLAAVIAEPDDVARRLVYADWLVERGDAQGELIHLCERRSALGRPDPEIDLRIGLLGEQYRERIAGEVAQLASDYTLNRGFVYRIKMSAPTFAKHGARLLAAHPIQELELEPVNAKALARLGKADAVRPLRRLKIGQIIGHERPMPLHGLGQSTRFESLRDLSIWTWTCEGDPAEQIAASFAPQLSSLLLYEVDRSARVLTAFARSEGPHLRRVIIDLRERDEWPPGLFAAPGFDQLHTLRLSTRGAAATFERAKLPALRRLGLRDAAPLDLTFPTLRSLHLDGPIDAPTLMDLLDRHPQLTGIRVYELPNADVERVLVHLLALPSERPLRAVGLPTHGCDPGLVARVHARFPGDLFHDYRDSE